MLRLHDYLDSGNGFKVRLLLRFLGRPYELVELDIMEGETHTPEFLAKNPAGRIPVLETEDGRFLPESGAILWYLAEGTAFLPESAWERAQVLRWLFFEQYSHEPFVAGARFIVKHLPEDDPRQAELPDKRARGCAALEVMEGHLKDHAWFVGARPNIADIALYAYTHVAHEGGFDMSAYPAIEAWCDRIAAQPGYVGIMAG
jgi:glutathione S-transferase